jgi:glutathione peroxidase
VPDVEWTAFGAWPDRGISVKGNDIHPLYRFLTEKEINPRFAGATRWNFQKFLVDKKGEVVGRFDPNVDPMSKEVTEAVEKALKESAGNVEREKR